MALHEKTRESRRPFQFILKEQEPDGSWFGRWGVNYLYGTFLVLRGLEAMGFWNHEPAVQQGGGVDSHGAKRRRGMGRELRDL